MRRGYYFRRGGCISQERLGKPGEEGQKNPGFSLSPTHLCLPLAELSWRPAGKGGCEIQPPGVSSPEQGKNKELTGRQQGPELPCDPWDVHRFFQFTSCL